jgi:GNAT superfamily N-acetyltransferase
VLRYKGGIIKIIYLHCLAHISKSPCCLSPRYFRAFAQDFIDSRNILFVLFFAVEDTIRGKGYGSAILDYLKESNPEKSVLLNVELLDPSADNYEERVRRFRFYERNGFYDTKYDIEEVGGVFRVLATAPAFDNKEYLRVFRKMSFGFWRPRIMQAERKDD